ncbi:ABC transporter substrate-binding protein [Nocardioides szechwanensis]|uniref:Phospholipid/cholesterol/gamma-HCH transport system substrate-binding protein n=1 Tax=Nocardioides szechwanensis TaxID=1005944 RepID=A0A1G9Z3S4_9ACTN|nr:MCE family protein [Nocardioides szechwanensis]GEP33801.1 ABC transporter substrate-binding protein [Nocardioides szechwanensis]SDN15857.1 phospholipid/cholesterol/gamma-HCH transport system substrate-binding protein [Nocardioides szechwanensis]
MKILSNHKVLGVAFLVLLVAGVYATYSIFTKKYVDYDRVTLQTSSIGLQLPARADVKIRGVIVGEVLEFDTAADGAQLTLGLFPEEVDTIPANVTGSIVPKTLFGEKYVSLVVPEQPAADHIQTGDTIERTEVSIEVEKVLADLYPLLRAVQPAEINLTLNALATALEGRGEQIGENLETVDGYLKQLNPQIPGLVEDLRLTAEVSDIYSDVLPEVAQILQDSITTTGTLEDRSVKLNALFKDIAAFSETARTFLADNGDNITRLGEVSAAQLEVLAKYAPGFPCLTEGIVNAGKLQAEAFRGFTLHIVLETLPRQPRGYNPQDKPRTDTDRGPTCLHLPNPPWSQSNPVRHQPDFNDGVDEPTGKGTSRVSPFYDFDGAGEPGSAEESALLKELMSRGFGVSASEVSDLSVLLVAPMARGAEVSLR